MARAHRKRIIVVGAGPGGVTAAMLLAARGFDVEVFEAKSEVGGRNAGLRLGDYTFDTGPTFLMMDFVLREAFASAGRRLEDYLTLDPLDPLYTLRFHDRDCRVTRDRERMRAEIARLFPGNEAGYDRFLAEERRRFEALMPCLTRPYDSLASYLSPSLLRALPQLSLGRSVFRNLARYFDDDELILSFTFQSKYLGMSAWECPALFTMLPFVEHEFGISHVRGGLHQIPRAMSRLVPPEKLSKYRPDRLAKLDFSCSTFMLYLGLDREVPLSHHTIFFAKDYRKNVRELFNEKKLSTDDFSFYLQNASVTDPTLAPPGKSALYVLVPVPNQRSGIDWQREAPAFRRRVLALIEERTGLQDIERSIEVERVITPHDWEHQMHVYAGATFNLSHRWSQMLHRRPHNEFEEFRNCYLVGGGTHPGSGLPVIYESARISADLISQRFGAAPSRAAVRGSATSAAHSR
jgi:phytoene desaturase